MLSEPRWEPHRRHMWLGRETGHNGTIPQRVDLACDQLQRCRTGHYGFENRVFQLLASISSSRCTEYSRSSSNCCTLLRK